MDCAVIVLPIPANIPMPRYRLFQAIRTEDGQGTIVGLQYLAESEYVETGWHYAIQVEGAAARVLPIEVIAEGRLTLESATHE